MIKTLPKKGDKVIIIYRITNEGATIERVDKMEVYMNIEGWGLEVAPIHTFKWLPAFKLWVCRINDDYSSDW